MDLIANVIELIETLVGPKGCPWNQIQTPSTLIHYLIEETYETKEALFQKNRLEIKEEVGDLVFNLVFILYLLEKEYGLSEEEIAQNIQTKIKRRHPHVFELPVPITLEELALRWEEIKEKERDQKKHPYEAIPPSLPPLAKAQKLYFLLKTRGLLESRHQKKITDEEIGEGFWSLCQRALDAGIDIDQAFSRTLEALMKKTRDQV